MDRRSKEGVGAISTDAIFFDFDGVLVESTDFKIHAFEELYRDVGPDNLARVMAYMRVNEGISRLDKIRHCHRTILGIELDDQEVAGWGERFRALVEDGVVSCNWVPGAAEFLERYHRELPLFVVTGTPQEEILRILTRRKMSHYFVSVHGSPPRKPPIVRDLLDRHGFSPERTLFVGDARADYEAAHANGVRFVGRLLPGGSNGFPSDVPVISDLTSLTL